MPPDKLVSMVNQIGQFFATQPGSEAMRAEDVAVHLRRFWAPRMRAALMAHDGTGLDPLPLAAVAALRRGDADRATPPLGRALVNGPTPH